MATTYWTGLRTTGYFYGSVGPKLKKNKHTFFLKRKNANFSYF